MFLKVLRLLFNLLSIVLNTIILFVDHSDMNVLDSSSWIGQIGGSGGSSSDQGALEQIDDVLETRSWIQIIKLVLSFGTFISSAVYIISQFMLEFHIQA